MNGKNSVTEYAYAKINLWLDVLGKRSDGYHDILSVMQSVSLHDTLKISVAKCENRMICSERRLPCDERNLCIKAADAFKTASGIKEGVFIELQKVIPSQAGLGGGSSDAAAVLRGMNRLFGDPFDLYELRKIGKALGADVPFCVSGGTMLAEGIGELLSELPSLPKTDIVISGGIGHVSTAEAYRIIDSVKPSNSPDFGSFRGTLEKGDIKELSKKLYNRFEDTVPESKKVKAVLSESGAMGALMSGSGTAVYGIFESEDDAKKAEKALVKAGLSAFVCHTVQKIAMEE